MQGEDPEAAELLSRDRLDGFRDGTGDSDKILVGRYVLNAAIAEALHPLLHALEVILRNRLNESAAALYPVDPDSPAEYHHYPSWLDATQGPIAHFHRKHVDEAKAKVAKDLRRRYGPGVASARRMRTPGRLVAALPFSFWVYLFDQEYSGTRASPGSLWPELLPQVFPHARGVALSEIRNRLRRLLVVRNRVMHHERIYPYSDGRGLSWDPGRVRVEILELLSWMSPRARAMVEHFDRVPEVMHPVALRYVRWIPWRF
jgi:hypothetical protein